VAKTDLAELLEQLDEDTRLRWERVLERVENEVAEKGPLAVREHLDRALEHLLSVGWALRRCYAADEVLRLLGDAASTVEGLRAALDGLAKKPEWSQ
jgi:hypothetical protein